MLACISGPSGLRAALTAALAGQVAGILARLRAETVPAHRAIEQTLALTDETLTLASYTRRLEQFYGYYRPLEAQLLVARNNLAEWLDVEPRSKARFLQDDLSALGRASADSLPLCRELPELGGPAECFGCLYVLEGATLGGVLISRHIRENLGITPDTGGRFFNAYGERNGAMWHEFRAALTSFAEVSDDHELIITAARTTFETLHHWCEEKRVP